jgi:hypothetical protein
MRGVGLGLAGSRPWSIPDEGLPCALGVAIRQGQATGEIVKSGDIGGGGRGGDKAALTRMSIRNDLGRPVDFAPANELSTGIYPMTDNVTDEQFESALESAKEEGNLSRANVTSWCVVLYVTVERFCNGVRHRLLCVKIRARGLRVVHCVR